MADRLVTATEKASTGRIRALRNAETKWQRRCRFGAIEDIERGRHRYYVNGVDGQPVWVEVFRSGGQKYLRTEQDSSSENNLGNLPDP